MNTYIKKQLELLLQIKQPQLFATLLTSSDQDLIMKRANELLEQVFVFNKPWDMERCITPYKLEKDFDWNVTYNDDEEWTFMLNRMDYLNYLIYAGYLTNNNDYFNKAKEYIFYWIHSHKVLNQTPSTRTLDTGIRMMNIFECLPFLYDLGLVSNQELECITTSLYKQAMYLKQEYLTKYTLSNWGVIQTCSIVSILPYVLEDYERDPIYIWAIKECKTQFNIQVNNDGIHWEYSPMYQVEVLNYGLKAYYYQSLLQIDTLSYLKETLVSMTTSLFHLATPSLELECYGDTDRISIKDVATMTCSLLKQPSFKSLGTNQFDLETLYVLGSTKAKDYETLVPPPFKQTIFDANYTHLYANRTNWSNQADYLLFLNTGLGSGHGHSDNLHVSLCMDGKGVLVDSGRYTYREDHPLRTKLKGPYSHNCILIDDQSSCNPDSSWTYSDFGIPLSTYVNHKGNISYYEGSFMDHNPTRIVRRKIVAVMNQFYLIINEGYLDGTHNLTSYYHFDPSIEDLSTLNMDYSGNVSTSNDVMSVCYNIINQHIVMKQSIQFENHGCTHLCFMHKGLSIEPMPVYQNGTTPVDNSIVSSFKVTISPDESYSIAIFHEEIYNGKKIFFLNGIPFHSQVACVHEYNHTKELIQLNC